MLGNISAFAYRHRETKKNLRAGLGRLHPDPARKLSANLYVIYLSMCVQWRTADDGQRNCPKHVEFYPKNKFEKLVHLFGFYDKNLSWYTVTCMSNYSWYSFLLEAEATPGPWSSYTIGNLTHVLPVRIAVHVNGLAQRFPTCAPWNPKGSAAAPGK